MNEVLQDGSNKSPLLSGEEAIEPPLHGGTSFIFEDNKESLDEVKPLPLSETQLRRNDLGSGVTRINSGSFKEGQKRVIPSSGSFGYFYKKDTLTQRQQALFIAEKNKQLLNKNSEDFKTEFTRWDKAQIVFYHLIEPLLLGSMIGTSLQISSLETMIYLLFSFLIIMPMLLTNEMSRIKIKRTLCFIIIGFSLVFLLFKFWVYYQFTDTKNLNSNHYLTIFLGVDIGQWAATFITDMITAVIGSLLIWHYYSQISQLEAREKQQGTLKYQMKIKFFHYLLGQTAEAFYLIAFILFLIDTFFYQTIVQVLILMVQTGMLFVWSLNVPIPSKLQTNFLRFTQVLTFTFLVISFIFSMPKIFNSFILTHPELFRFFGLEQIVVETLQPGGLSVVIIWYTSVHKFILSYAIVMTEVYFTCKKVSVETLIKEKAVAAARELQEQAAAPSWSNQLILASSSSLSEQRIIRRFSRSNLMNSSGKSKPVQHSLTDQIELAWEFLQSSVYLWTCRILCFVWIYMYHDVQSLVVLFWLLHSSLFQSSANFAKATSYLYLPLMMVIFVFYYSINIYGVYCQSDAYTSLTIEQQRRLYTFGIYPFRFASLECAFMFLTLFSLAIYTRRTYVKLTVQSSTDPAVPQKGVFNVLDFNKSTFSQFIYLGLVYMKYPIFLLLVMSGLGKMDFYHIFLLFVFVWAALYPQAFEKNIIWLLVYADFFVFIKYLYTLIIKQPNPQQPWMWLSIIGISTQYNPQTDREYFRYAPLADQWLLVLLAYIQYRRANLIGTDLKQIEKNEESILGNLAVKYPFSAKVARFISVLINHGIVIIAFLGYLLTLTFMRRSILNLVSFVLLLLLLASYLIGGIKVLLKQWPIVGFYQAFVLLSILAYQFACQSPGLADYPFYKNTQTKLGPYGSAMIYWAGYYKFDQPIWYYFLPYVLMFFFAILLTQQFKRKALHEEKALIVSNAQNLQVSEFELVDPSVPGRINQSEVLQQNQIELSSLQQVKSPDFTPEQIKERFYDMQYKLSYLLWKMKLLWPIFDAISLYFNLILSSVILAFAIYFQIAVIWFVYLLVFLFQTLRLYQNHQQYKVEQYERFLNLQQANNELSQIRTFSALQARKNKLTLNQEQKSNKVVVQILKNDAQKINSNFSSLERLLVTDEQAIEEYKIYKKTIHLVTLQSRGFYWASQYVILTAAFTLLYLGAFIPTTYGFPPGQPTTFVRPIPDINKSNKVLFLLFASGLYSDINNPSEQASLSDRRELMSDYYPFFILLFLLIVEKLCQIWLTDQFNTNEESIQLFEKIEDDYKKLKTLLNAQDKSDQSRERRGSASRQVTEPLQTDPSLGTEEPEEEEKYPNNAADEGDPQLLGNTDVLEHTQQQQNPILFNDLPVEMSRKSSSSSRGSFQVIDDENDKGYSARFTYNPNSDTVIQKKREMMQQIKPRLQVKSQVKLDLAMRALFVELIIMLVWFSCIYKQSVLSFILFFGLVFHTYSQDSNKTISVVGLTVFSVFIIEYVMALASLSSYNSPQPFPTQIAQITLPDGTSQNTVYPNAQHYYFAIPLYFKLSSNITTSGEPSINVQFWSFFNFYVNGQRLNGIWIDFAVIALAFVYLNLYNLWILQEPIKIIPSITTNELIRSYFDLNAAKRNQRNEDQLRRELAAEIPQNRAIKSFSSMVYTNFSLLMIMFLLFISIFAKSLLSLGYFIFSMLLIYNNRNFFKDSDTSSAQIYILKYWLMPYLLLDILLQLILEIPLSNQANRLMENPVLGLAFKEVWVENPQYVTLGDNVIVTTELQSSMVALFLKGMLYFMISVQILIVQSMGFKNFSDNVLIDNVKNANFIGKGIAYRFNNFKNKRVIASARNYGLLEKMLNHVKKLLKRRTTMYKEILDKSLTPKIKIPATDVIIEEEEKHEDDEFASEQSVRIDNETQINELKRKFKGEVDVEYKKRIEELDWASSLYLWLRRNYVQDILFKHSDDHLIDMVAQFEQGRTSIRSQLEIGILMQTKLDWLKAQLTRIKEKAKRSELEEDFKLTDEFQMFRREQIALMEPKSWERLNLRTFRTTKKLLINYLVMFYKILASYTHFFCYFFMMLALLSNGGLLYLVYPFIIFGIAMMEERRPGRVFWYFVIIYTQTLIILQFLAQLEVWGTSSTHTNFQTIGANILDFSNRYNLGLKVLNSDSFAAVLKQFYPEILILVFVLLHIQQETLAGLFDVSLENYEAFQDGLDRYIKIVLAQDTKALRIYQEEQMINRIKEGLAFDPASVLKRRNSAPDQLYSDKDIWNSDPQWLYDVNLELLKYPLEAHRTHRRAFSLVDKKDLDNFAEQVKIRTQQSTWQKTKGFFSSSTKVFWNNEFFDRLFPIIKQQKPGIDMYVWIALIEIFLCFYIIIWFPKLTNQNNSTLAQQIQSNQLQGPMVVALFVIIGIAVVDRIFYTTFAFMNRAAVNKKLNINAPLINSDSSVVIAEGREIENSQPLAMQRGSINSNQLQQYDVNRSRQESLYGATRQSQQTQLLRERSDSYTSNSHMQGTTNPNDISMTDNEDLDQKEQHAYYQSLLPQTNEKGVLKVFKFYWFWTVLILVHYYIFLHLAKQPATCPIKDPRCNLLNTNTALMVFYLIFCIYFMVGSYQIQVGLPELKKGGFMQGQYNSVSKIVYETWYYIPFLFELRTIIDWTFTSTALDVFQSIKLAQAQSDLYIAKCYNKPYMAKELGSEIKWYMKGLIGVTLTLFILLLIGGPILLFSTFNPVSTNNPVQSATLSVAILIQNGSLSTFTIPLFETRQVTKLSTLSQQEYDQFGFGNATSTQTNQFKANQVQIIQFGQNSDTVWLISPPNLMLLTDALITANYTPQAGNGTSASEQAVYILLQSDFTRNATQASKGQFIYQKQMYNNTPTIINGLLNALECLNPNGNSIDTGVLQLDIGIELMSGAAVKAINISPPIPAGVNLTYFCNVTFNSSNYWNLAPIYPETNAQTGELNPFYDAQVELLTTTSGFGFIVFSSTVLPAYLAAYSSSVIFFYAAVVYVVASAFRSAFVPVTSQIFITDAVLTEDILMVCQCVYIYRIQRNHKNEEELYMILIDILRSPEMIKSISGPSLKKELD